MNEILRAWKALRKDSAHPTETQPAPEIGTPVNVGADGTPAPTPDQDHPDRLDEIKQRAQWPTPPPGADFPVWIANARRDRDWLIGEVERLRQEIAARAGAWKRLNESCDSVQHTAVLRQDQAERAERWLSELASALGMEGQEPSALLWRVRDLAGEAPPPDEGSER